MYTYRNNSTVMDITFICKIYCKSFFLFSPLPFLLTNRCTVSNVYSKVSVSQIRKTIHLPVLFSECPNYGGHRESGQIGLYSLSCFPHCHSMNKNMVYHSCPNLIWNYYSWSSSSLSLYSSSSSTTSYTNSSSSSASASHIVSIHCSINTQCTWATCVLWTGLYSRQLIWSHH